MHAPQFDNTWLESVAQVFGWNRGPGLSEQEITRIELAAELHVPDDLRALMAYATPAEQGHLDWRHPEFINLFMAEVADGMWSDFEVRNIWNRDFGPRPPDASPRSRKHFDSLVAKVPKLIPIQGHICMPSKPRNAGNPVLSINRTDLICVGADLWSWAESKKGQGLTINEPMKKVPFWGPAFLNED